MIDTSTFLDDIMETREPERIREILEDLRLEAYGDGYTDAMQEAKEDGYEPSGNYYEKQ